MTTSSKATPKKKPTRTKHKVGTGKKNQDAALPRVESWTADHWQQIQDLVDSKGHPTPLSCLVGDKSPHPLKWAVPAGCSVQQDDSFLRTLIQLNSHRRRSVSEVVKELPSWLSEAAKREPDQLFALECLSWCHLLPRLTTKIDQDLWTRLLGQLIDIASDAAALSLYDDPVTQQVLEGEVQWSIAYLLPEIEGHGNLASSGQEALSRGTVELLDGQGMPAARYFPQLRSLLACWTRCQLLGRESESDCMDRAGTDQYEWFVRQSLRMTRADGSQMFTSDRSGGRCDALLTAAVECGGDSDDRQIAGHILPTKKKSGKPGKQRPAEDLPEPHAYSEWAEVCVMRDSWKKKSPYCATLFDERSVRLELSVDGGVLFTGNWIPTVEINGSVAAPSSDWRELCWYADDDVDYLELEVDLGKGWQLQRQLLFGRSDPLLFVADAILGKTNAQISYTGTMALADGIDFCAEQETCDGLIGAVQKDCYAVFPLALPEWRTQNGNSDLDSQEDCLVLRQSAVGSAMYAPLLFDLSSRRSRKERTWRQLTVAERLAIQPADVAVGFRAQSGKDQWLVYRSLAPKANRTLLGQNTSDEFVFARFGSDGESDALIEVD